MDSYPRVINEAGTIASMKHGSSIARFGDGEFRLCFGKKSISQLPDPKLQEELRHIIKSASSVRCLVGIPPVKDHDITDGVKTFYADIGRQRFLQLPEPSMLYHSSYITRPNFKPSFYTDEYQESVIDLWRDKDVVLVVSKHHGDGNPTSLRPARMPEAKSVHMVYGPWRDAYAEIDRLEKEIADEYFKYALGPVFLCLGATATVLAWRLAQRGITAYDVGHLGQYVQRWRTERTIYKGVKNVPACD